MTPGNTFLENRDLKFGKMGGVKAVCTEENIQFTPFFMIFHDFEDHSGLARVLHFPKLSNILKNHDLPKFIKRILSKCDFL